ncbi:MAG: C45 family autoproteolytic acyltransferase/hydrolase [Promethearchaeota archaeon]
MVVFIEISGNHYELGYKQALKFKDQTKIWIKKFFYSDFIKNAKPSFVPTSLVKQFLGIWGKFEMKKSIKQYLPNQYEKLRGLAEGAKISQNLILGVNFIEILAGHPMIFKNPPKQACTQLFAKDSATAQNEIFFARNYDFPKVLRDLQGLRLEMPEIGYKNFNANQFGQIGCHMGLNEKGLAIGLNYGQCWKKNPLDYRTKGIPSSIIIQEILETCKSTKEAVDFIINFPARANGAFYGIADKNGDICVVETTATRSAVRKINEDNLNKENNKNDFLVHTNLFMTEELKDANLPDDIMWKLKGLEIPHNKSPRERYKRAYELMKSNKGKINEEILKSILSDHKNGEPNDFTICTHGEVGVTLASFIINLSKMEFLMTNDFPCKNKYEIFKF